MADSIVAIIKTYVRTCTYALKDNIHTYNVHSDNTCTQTICTETIYEFVKTLPLEQMLCVPQCIVQ